MNIDFTKSFNKQFEKLPAKKQKRTQSAIALFIKDDSTLSLRNHTLKGKWVDYRSISAGGDLRLHFKVIGTNTILFVAVGTHSQLYK
jgi:addiction module RelE/StbE family toxin